MRKIKTVTENIKQKISSIILTLSVAYYSIGTTIATNVATSASTDAGRSVVSVIKTVLAEIRTIAIPVGILCFAIALLMYIFSKNPKTVEAAKDWMKRIAIGVFAIVALETIVNTFLSLTGTTNTYENFIN